MRLKKAKCMITAVSGLIGKLGVVNIDTKSSVPTLNCLCNKNSLTLTNLRLYTQLRHMQLKCLARLLAFTVLFGNCTTAKSDYKVTVVMKCYIEYYKCYNVKIGRASC